MNARRNYPKLTSLFIALSASLTLLSCGSFQGASYFSSDGIYNARGEVRNVSPQQTESNNGSYYSKYFSDAAQGTLSENEMIFTDTENYTTDETYADESSYVESSQIPWGEKTSQTEVVIIDRTPNYFWGLSGFAFRASPFWNSYYFNDPFRFGYGIYGAPFVNPYIDPYFGGYAGYWGYDPFYSPYGYPGFRFGYGWNRWNRRNRWNRWNQWDYYGSNGYGTHGMHNSRNDYRATVARVKSGRGEKNYEGSRTRSEKISDRNAKSNNKNNSSNTINRVNYGRGINSFGGTYLATTRNGNELGTKSVDKSKTARPTYGSSLASSNAEGTTIRANSNPSKGVQGNNTRGRFSQSRYSLGARKNVGTRSPRVINSRSTRVNRSSNTNRRSYSRPSTQKRNYSSTRSSSPSRSYNSQPSRATNSRSNYNSSSNYRSSAPSRSYSSGGGSRASGSSGRGSSGGRRN